MNTDERRAMVEKQSKDLFESRVRTLERASENHLVALSAIIKLLKKLHPENAEEVGL